MSDEMENKVEINSDEELSAEELDEVAGGHGSGGGAGKLASPQLNLLNFTNNTSQMGDGSVKPGNANLQDFH